MVELGPTCDTAHAFQGESHSDTDVASAPTASDGQGDLCSSRPRIDHTLVNTMVGEYRVTGVIGEGGMGTVFAGEQPVIGKRVAINLAHRPGGGFLVKILDFGVAKLTEEGKQDQPGGQAEQSPRPSRQPRHKVSPSHSRTVLAKAVRINREWSAYESTGKGPSCPEGPLLSRRAPPAWKGSARDKAGSCRPALHISSPSSGVRFIVRLGERLHGA